MNEGTTVLPDLQITDSSEAMLSGRKPPLRLYVEASFDKDVERLYKIRPAISEAFVVATRRTKTSGKAEIPYVDEHVSKLEHMGKETVRKLASLKESFEASGMSYGIPVDSIKTVGDFRQLALLADVDQQFRKNLQHILKFSADKFNEAREHAIKAIVPDNRMRVWYPDSNDPSYGILFACRLGCIDMRKPAGVLVRAVFDGETKDFLAPLAARPPTEREQLCAYHDDLVDSWWRAGHPGWSIYPADSEKFVGHGIIEISSIGYGYTSSLSGELPTQEAAGLTNAASQVVKVTAQAGDHRKCLPDSNDLPTAFANNLPCNEKRQRDRAHELEEQQVDGRSKLDDRAPSDPFLGFPPFSPTFVADEDIDLLFSQHGDGLALHKLPSWALGRLASIDFKSVTKGLSLEVGSSHLNKIVDAIDKSPTGLESMHSVEEALSNEFPR